MTLVPTSSLLAEAVAAGEGIAAFNIITLEQLEAVLRAAAATDRPVIVQVSENAIRFHQGDAVPILRAATAAIGASDARASLHLDHSMSLDLCKAAVREGASSVMFDASHLDYRDNVEATRAAARWAEGEGILLEAELGAIGGKGGAHAPGVRTDPDEARSFVAETGAHALAVAVGSVHAQQERNTLLDLALIEAIHREVEVPLVLHGSSGVPDDAIAAAVRSGITKVNIGTALNVAFTGALREHLMSNERQSDPRPGLQAAGEALTRTGAHLLGVVRARATRVGATS
jgi:fructose-bisphosphate aldolase class II